MGNPINWRNAGGLVWQGRRLTRFSHIDGEQYAYTYNADGIRTGKQIRNADNVLITGVEYIYDGSKLVAEIRDGLWMYYVYDETGSIAGLSYNNTLYFFRKNLQGDVTGIYNANGALVVEYTYSPYGEVLSVTGTMANTIGTINPIRYRGYYYDTETGLYYLITRYYDPVVGRFLNVDSIMYIGPISANMFAYCCNNSIKYIDPCGTCPHDGKFYVEGRFAGKPQYNPNCANCMSHGSYSLLSNAGVLYDFRDLERDYSKSLSQAQITEKIESLIIVNMYYALNDIKLDIYTFRAYVSAGGPMDYKDPYIWAKALPDVPYPGESKDYVAFGIAISSSDLGNLNYGIVGKVFGFSEELLLWQAGAAQLRDHSNYDMAGSEIASWLLGHEGWFGDQEDDYYMIKQGFNLF